MTTPISAITVEQIAALVTIGSAAISVVSIVAGVVISILSINSTRKREAEARQIEAAKPFSNYASNFIWKQQRQ